MTAASRPSDALLATNAYARHVVARLLDFFADTSPWPRRLWQVGSVLALREAAEAGNWIRMKALHTKAVQNHLYELKEQLDADLGLGDTKLRNELNNFLFSAEDPDSSGRRRLIQLIPVIMNGYVERWTTAVDSTRHPTAERLARALATHLFDCGHSSGPLHSWADALSGRPGATLTDLLADARKLADQDDRVFEVLVPFSSIPDHRTLKYHLSDPNPRVAR